MHFNISIFWDVNQRFAGYITSMFGVENQPSKELTFNSHLLHSAACEIFDLEDGSDIFLLYFGTHTDYMALDPRRWLQL
jgi:hypothetical protein